MPIFTAQQHRRRFLPVLFVILGIIVFINVFSGVEYRLFPAVIRLEMKWCLGGRTRLALPPIGEIRAPTHWLPIWVSLEVKSVNLPFLRTLVYSPPQALASLRGELMRELRLLLSLFVLKLVVLGAAGGVFALVFLGTRDGRQLFWAGASGAIVTALLVLTLVFTYDLAAFESLEYEGVIEAAPWALNLFWEAAGKVEELGERTRVLAGNLYSALERFEELGQVGLADTALVALHVSDIHNNPVAYDFIAQVIESFPVSVVLDTGDLTDWGTALEAEVATRIERLQVPYVFAAGNHESPEVMERLAAIENVIIVDGTIQTVAGLKIAGVPDLVAGEPLPESASLADLNNQARELNGLWEKAEELPDVFLLHNHRTARALRPGLFPIVVCGHSHRSAVEQVEGTVYINAGTTGAAGIRGFQTNEPLPYSLALLYFQEIDGELVLQAVDSVFITGLGTSFSLQRTFIEHSRNRGVNVENIR